MCDPTGFRFEWISATDGLRGLMGDEPKFAPGQTLVARFPVSCHIRLLSGGRLVAEQSGDRLELPIKAPGVYRIEGWLPWVAKRGPGSYSNPIYVR